MAENRFYPYHYGKEADQYTFYQIPKLLFTDEPLIHLSTDAKLLYGLLLDRMKLSQKNHWMDDTGRVYIYFPVDQIMTILHCGNKKVCSLLAELDDKKGVGLITRVRQGQGKADRIYVKKCIGGMKKPVQDDAGEQREESVLPPEMDWERTYREYREILKEQLDYDCLVHDYPYQKETLAGILDLLTDVMVSSKSEIRIGGELRPVQLVKNRFMKLKGSHIRYVLLAMEENTTSIKNIHQYMLTALYNAPSTMEQYYQSRVNHDMYGRRD